MKETVSFLNKRVKLAYTNGFVLEGVVVEVSDYGVMFKTSTKTSFISWVTIRDITPLE